MGTATSIPKNITDKGSEPTKEEQWSRVYDNTYYLFCPFSKRKFVEQEFKTWQDAHDFMRNFFPFKVLDIVESNDGTKTG